MRTLIALILLALMLSGCASHPEPTTCPAPAGELLVLPAPLARLQSGPMTQQMAVTEWLNDMELFKLQRGRYIALQSWGVTQCKWPAIKGQ